MEEYVKRMVDEHKELVDRISKLEKYIYVEHGHEVDRGEYANKCLQLKGMRMYEEALRARLLNVWKDEKEKEGKIDLAYGIYKPWLNVKEIFEKKFEKDLQENCKKYPIKHEYFHKVSKGSDIDIDDKTILNACASISNSLTAFVDALTKIVTELKKAEKEDGNK